MGIYLNPDNTDFQEAINSKIYIDKTELIAHTNSVIRTMQKNICVSRPRRFGKSMAANMLTAYYSRGCDSAELFEKCKIAKNASYHKHLNQYNGIHINIVVFLEDDSRIEDVLDTLSDAVLYEIRKAFPDVDYYKPDSLSRSLKDVYAAKNCSFIFIIDDCAAVANFSIGIKYNLYHCCRPTGLRLSSNTYTIYMSQ